MPLYIKNIPATGRVLCEVYVRQTVPKVSVRWDETFVFHWRRTCRHDNDERWKCWNNTRKKVDRSHLMFKEQTNDQTSMLEECWGPFIATACLIHFFRWTSEWEVLADVTDCTVATALLEYVLHTYLSIYLTIQAGGKRIDVSREPLSFTFESHAHNMTTQWWCTQKWHCNVEMPMLILKILYWKKQHTFATKSFYRRSVKSSHVLPKDGLAMQAAQLSWIHRGRAGGSSRWLCDLTCCLLLSQSSDSSNHHFEKPQLLYKRKCWPLLVRVALTVVVCSIVVCFSKTSPNISWHPRRPMSFHKAASSLVSPRQTLLCLLFIPNSPLVHNLSLRSCIHMCYLWQSFPSEMAPVTSPAPVPHNKRQKLNNVRYQIVCSIKIITNFCEVANNM